MHWRTKEWDGVRTVLPNTSSPWFLRQAQARFPAIPQ